MSDESLVYGVLNKETFEDFLSRMRHQVRGEGVNDHATCDAVFVVKCKTLISEIDKANTDDTVLFIDDSRYFSFEEFAENHDNEELDLMIKEGCPIEFDGDIYSCARDYDFFEWVEDKKGSDWCATHTGYDWKWEYVNHHITMEAAKAFIKRKSHDYGEMMVYVDSAYWSWELKAIMNGLLDGKIVFKE